MFRRSDIILILCCVAWFASNVVAQYPRSPCPSMFRYKRSFDGVNFARLELEGYIDYGITVVEVELSQPGHANPDYKGEVVLDIDINEVRQYIAEQTPVPFKVRFQYPDVIPYLVAIRVNDVTICSGPIAPNTPRTKITLRRRLTIHGSSPTQRGNMASRPSPSPEPTAKSTVVNLQYINSVCGMDNSRIKNLAVQAQFIAKSRFPWIVAIFEKGLGSMKFQCGASLISTKTVISAAHCFYKESDLISEQNILISLGRHELNDWISSGAVHRNVERLIQHPDYSPESASRDADLAIVLLEQSVTFTDTIRPICLWSGSTDVDDIVGLSGIVVGWGSDENNNTLTNTPKLINATIASDTACLESDPQFFFSTSNRTLCAGDLNGSGPCTGDSGAGLMLRKQNKWMLRGIVSAALSDVGTHCDLKKYVIYADTAQFKNWIRSNMIL